MVRGIDLMLAGIYIVSNVTNQKNDKVYRLAEPNRYNWDVKWQEQVAKLRGPPDETIEQSVVKVATLETVPYSGTAIKDGKRVGVGHAFKILTAILSSLNLEYEIVMPKHPGIGNETSGVIGLLYEKKVDLVAAMTPFLWRFYEHVWYSPILEDVDIMALLLRPRESAIGSGLLAPFDTTVWICILVCTFFFGPVIFVFSTYRSFLWDYTKIDRFNFTASAWFVYGAILKQGSSINPINNSTRIVFATWWIFITILTSFYTANLTAFLTLSEFTLPFTTMEQIVGKKIHWVAAREYTISNVLGTGHGKSMNTLNNTQKWLGSIRPFNHTNEVLKILYPKQLFVGEREPLEETVYQSYIKKVRTNHLQKLRCNFVIMPEVIYKVPRGFMHQKQSPLQRAIDKRLQNLFEVGIFTHHRKTIAPKVKYCPLDLKSTERTLSNTDLSLTYKIITGGFILSILTFIYEMIKTRKTRKTQCLCCSWKCFCCRQRLKVSKEIEHKAPELPQRNNYVTKLPTDNFNNNIKHQNNRNIFRNEIPVSKISPIYESVRGGDNSTTKKIYINGRDYWQITESTGNKKLIPIRTPSALLFQYRT